MENFWLFLLLVYSLMASSLAQTNLTTDQSALLALKNHITFDPDHVYLANNWSTAASCCNWIGVTCGIRHQRVTALNLANLGLIGTIPPHLGNISFLASLNLRNNSFRGQLPDELSFLRRLKVLNLGYNNLNGAIPSWFYLLPNLESLLLSYNGFSGEIPHEMGNLDSLKILRITNSGLTGRIPAAIFNISSIEVIDFTNNSLSGRLPEDMSYRLKELSLSVNQLSGPIPNALWKQRKLVGLSLSFNQFEGSIPRDIGNLTAIKEIHLSYNNFIGEIPEEVGYLQRLEKFSIIKNRFRGFIPTTLFNISSLVELSFRNNSLSGSLPLDMCEHLPALKILGLRNNNITGSIPRVIENCTSLVSLGLSTNVLTGAIPQELGNLQNLENIFLEFNDLTGSIPSKIFNISMLKIISLSSNHLSGQLPPDIGLGLPNLKELVMWGNKLSGIIPNSISNASELAILSLDTNSFTGFVPNTLGNLRLLERLNVEYNSLTTDSSEPELTFLTSLTNCRYLRVFGVSRNSLNGILPKSIGNFSTSLEQFFAGDCNIKGTIPREIGNLSNLIILQLGKNELTGPIPATFGRLQKLQGMELSENRLQGPIDDLCLIRGLAYLYLSLNELSESIPVCIGNLSSLRVLHLDSNKFNSVIPSVMSSLAYILDMNLSTNSLTGSLPSDIGILKVVRQLDFSRNKFSGDVPSTIGSLQSLVNLSLANNRLQGPIPQSFGDLISLELLDLSHNNLSGEIPKSLEELKYLKSLNVSFNSLQGEIPDGGPFAHFPAQSFTMNDALCGATHFQVSPCKTSTPRRSRKIVELLLQYALPALVITILVIIFICVRCRKRFVKLSNQTDLSSQPWRRISHLELLKATEGFSESNLLGVGSYGSVYEGILSDGVTVAVKVFKLETEGALKSFDAESEVLRNIRHRNLIKIISSCCNLDFKALVLQYMPNGSLEKWLYSPPYCLDILQRLNIMIDVASALEYLHHSYTTQILHCDLKPSNILLDEDMTAHVGDFGISKLLGEGESMAQTKTLATIGYMAPEYGSEGIVSTRNDVYGYGIVLMETFTRKKPSDEMFTENINLKSWVKISLPHAVTEVADANLLSEEEHFAAKSECISSILELALDCSAKLPEERIDIRDVLHTLKNIRTKFEMSIVSTDKSWKLSNV